MTYRTALSPQECAKVAESLGFSYLETSCHSTTYARNGDLLSIEEPEGETYEDLEIATDFRMLPHEIAAFGAWHV